MIGCGTGVSGWLLMVGFWVGIVAVVLWAVSRLFPAIDRRRDAEDLLDHRLAAGEIDADVYRRAREELVGAAGTTTTTRTSKSTRSSDPDLVVPTR